MAGCPDTGTPNLHLLLTGILPHAPRVLALFRETGLDKPMLWLNLLHSVLVVVDKAKTCRVTTSKLCVETENDDDILVRLALGRDKILDLIAGRSRSTGV